MNRQPPRVLCFSGHDPGGGAGIHADIEAIAAQRAHALTVITAMTVQDSDNVLQVDAVPADWLRAQAETLLADSPIAAIKIGLLGDATQIPLLLEIIARCRVPVICDPILRAGGGRELPAAAMLAALREQLIPAVDLLTPNAAELRRLVPDAASLAEATATLRARGARQLLVTGGDEAGDAVLNVWIDHGGTPHEFVWPRLPARFHGAGCTLAAAIAGRIASGDDWATAIRQGQHYTQRALASAYASGRGRLIPDRAMQ